MAENDGRNIFRRAIDCARDLLASWCRRGEQSEQGQSLESLPQSGENMEDAAPTASESRQPLLPAHRPTKATKSTANGTSKSTPRKDPSLRKSLSEPLKQTSPEKQTMSFLGLPYFYSGRRAPLYGNGLLRVSGLCMTRALSDQLPTSPVLVTSPTMDVRAPARSVSYQYSLAMPLNQMDLWVPSLKEMWIPPLCKTKSQSESQLPTKSTSPKQSPQTNEPPSEDISVPPQEQVQEQLSSSGVSSQAETPKQHSFEYSSLSAAQLPSTSSTAAHASPPTSSPASISEFSSFSEVTGKQSFSSDSPLGHSSEHQQAAGPSTLQPPVGHLPPIQGSPSDGGIPFVPLIPIIPMRRFDLQIPAQPQVPPQLPVPVFRFQGRQVAVEPPPRPRPLRRPEPLPPYLRRRVFHHAGRPANFQPLDEYAPPERRRHFLVVPAARYDIRNRHLLQLRLIQRQMRQNQEMVAQNGIGSTSNSDELDDVFRL